MAKMINAFRKDMECYSLDGDLTNNAIIMIIAKREVNILKLLKVISENIPLTFRIMVRI